MRALMIREDAPPGELRRPAKTEDDPRAARRLLAIAAALDGMSREAAARIAGMGRLMRDLDLSWQTPRPRHAETDRAAQERFKKGALPRRRCCPARTRRC